MAVHPKHCDESKEVIGISLVHHSLPSEEKIQGTSIFGEVQWPSKISSQATLLDGIAESHFHVFAKQSGSPVRPLHWLLFLRLVDVCQDHLLHLLLVQLQPLHLVALSTSC